MSISTTFGALLLGGLIAVFLSGTVCVQCYLYFKTFLTDSPRTKTLVSVVWTLDSLHTFFVCASLWQYLITEYGHGNFIEHVPTTLALSIACTAIVTICVHCFFAHRIYLFSRGNLYLTGTVVVLAVLRLCAASVTTGELIRLKSFPAYKRHFRPVFTLGLALSSTVDVIITASLCYFLRASRTQSTKLNSIIDSLLIYTFENGAVTSAATITSMICWLSMNDNLIFMGLHFVIGKLYANSFLATLHARQKLRNRRSESTGGDGPLPVTFLGERSGAPTGHYGQRVTPGHSCQPSSESAPTTTTMMSTIPGANMEISVMKTIECEVDDTDSNYVDDKQADGYETGRRKVEFASDETKGDIEKGKET